MKRSIIRWMFSQGAAVVILVAQPSPQAKAGSPSTLQLEALQRQALQATINQGTVTNKKGTFLATTAGGGEAGQVRSLDVAPISLETPKNLSKSEYRGPSEALHGSNLPWVITTYKLVETSKNGSVEASMSHYPADFKYLNSMQYQTEFSSMKNYVLSANIPDVIKADINLKLEELSKSYGSYRSEISVSHGSVRHFAKVWGAGMFNGRSWYKAYVNVQEQCVPQEMTDQPALRTKLKTWVDRQITRYATIRSLPYRELQRTLTLSAQ